MRLAGHASLAGSFSAENSRLGTPRPGVLRPGALHAAAALWIAFLAGLGVYRAAAQSITADEAFTYNHFAGGDEPVRVFDANNHVLFTWLARLSVAAFGLSEFSLRLPSVLAGWAYLAFVFVLARRWFTQSWLFALAVIALTLNPFVLDFLSAARGYGLALAFFAWAIYWAARDLEDAESSRARRLGIAACLALAAAANLNFVVPGAALVAAFSLLTALAKPPAAKRAVELARGLVLPGLALAAAILIRPLRTAGREAFYYGVETLRQTVDGLAFYSFFYRPAENPTPLQKLLWGFTPYWVAAVLAAAAASVAVLARVVRRKTGAWARGEGLCMLLALTAWLALGLLVLLKKLFGLKYPVDRTALYWIPLLTLTALALTATARGRLARLPALCLTAFLAAACAQYAMEFDTRYYAQWSYDAGTKRMVEFLVQREARQPRGRVRIGASWLFEPSLNFYRQRFGLKWLQKITRDGPRGDYDYYLLIWDDIRLVEEMNLEVLRRDPLSGAVLAVPRSVVQSRR